MVMSCTCMTFISCIIISPMTIMHYRRVKWSHVNLRCGCDSLQLLRFLNNLHCFLFNENHISTSHGLLLDWIPQSLSKFITWTTEIDAMLCLAIKLGTPIPRYVHKSLATKDLQVLV
jgi:hypothetical protein